ncbi:MAG: hypothetical protein PHW31_02575 [Candidatus Pacebacteria bacterium]|nr:hypothetical protein [Candidatus Paceibacterota bacterium]
MKKITYFIVFIAISLAVFVSADLIHKAFAQEVTGLQNIQYPVKELGNCQSESDCKVYCDKPENTEACLDFAQKNNLMAKEEIDLAKKFVAAGSEAPGGCKGKNGCEAYCNDIDNIDECVAYAESNNLMAPQELEEAKKVQAAIKRGVKPPACKNKEECDAYCEDPNHMEECINFGVQAGFIQGKELEDSQKMLAALKRGVKPPPCKGKEACDTYCGNPENMEECMTFAMEAGFMTEEEKANSQKMLSALKKGVKPPNCQGKEGCDVYCQQDEHFEECTNFAEAAGFMTAEEAAMARKTGGKGPGGCKGKDECEAFCNNPDNQETCFNFGKENGLIPEEDLKRMEEGKLQFKQTLEQAPQEVLDCLNSQIGADLIEKLKSGSTMPPRDVGDKMKTCFEQFMGSGGPKSEGGPGEGGMIPPAGQTGPGGCKTAEECKAYCESHPDECQQFQPGPGAMNPGNQTMPQQAGPGGCKSPEECQAYCQSNPEACQNFGSGEGGQFAPGTGPMGPGVEGQPGMASPEGQFGPPQGGEGFGPGPEMAPGTEGQPGQMTPGQFVQPGQPVPPEQMMPGAGGTGAAPPGGWQEAPPPSGFPEGPIGPQEGQIGPAPMEQQNQQMAPAPMQPSSGGGEGQIGPPPPSGGGEAPSPPSGGESGGGGGEAPPPPQSFLGPLEIFLGQILNAFERH